MGLKDFVVQEKKIEGKAEKKMSLTTTLTETEFKALKEKYPSLNSSKTLRKFLHALLSE